MTSAAGDTLTYDGENRLTGVNGVQFVYGADGKRIANQWPRVDWSDKNVEVMIVNSMNNLLGYPHRKEYEWGQYLSVSQDVVKATLRKLRATRSAASGQA